MKLVIVRLRLQTQLSASYCFYRNKNLICLLKPFTTIISWTFQTKMQGRHGSLHAPPEEILKVCIRHDGTLT